MALPPYMDPEVRKLDIHTRAELIYKYHVELNKIRCETQLKSKKILQWSTPIQATGRFSGSMFEEIEEEVTHSLRTSERLKNKQKSPTKSSHEDSILSTGTPRSDNFDMVEKEIDTTPSKRVTSPEKVLTTSRSSKVNVEEHIETTSSKSKKYSDNELVDSTAKIILKRNREILRSEGMLTDLSDDEVESESNDTDEYLPNHPKGITYRKRVPPPLHGKAKRTKNSSSQNLGAKRAKFNNSSDGIDNLTVGDTVAEEEEASSTNDSIPCPLCNKMFPSSEIEMHASNCCLLQSNDNDETVDTTEMIKCEACDKYFHFNTDYEVHVKDCLRLLRRKKGNNN